MKMQATKRLDGKEKNPKFDKATDCRNFPKSQKGKLA